MNDKTMVRVSILKSRDNFTISSSANLLVRDSSGYSFHPIHSSSEVYNTSRLNGTITIKSETSPLLLNGKPYRGMFELHKLNGFCYVINIVNIDEYLLSVVPGEIPSGWGSEALKAQAVAARTFAYYHLMTNVKSGALFDMDATTNFQVYRGISDERKSTTDAVIATSGEIITYHSQPIISYFHSTCGGKTVDDKYVWGQKDIEYLKSVECGYCTQSTKFNWESFLSLDEIQSSVSAKHNKIGKIKNIIFKRNQDRVTEVIIHHTMGKTSIAGNNFRLLFPPEKLRSLYFSSKKIKNGLVLKGHGWGHGVGMCQWGARGMALRGYGYQDILKHYYKNISLKDAHGSSIAVKSKQYLSIQ
jgi:stage II sporulation protein D